MSLENLSKEQTIQLGLRTLRHLSYSLRDHVYPKNPNESEHLDQLANLIMLISDGLTSNIGIVGIRNLVLMYEEGWYNSEGPFSEELDRIISLELG
ncbi:MAG: hypothetical protein NE327_00535 [Lentisphaeraceae bacterium]|nr:hypothetical protein [Lentisphaeraceae bacterium]